MIVAAIIAYLAVGFLGAGALASAVDLPDYGRLLIIALLWPVVVIFALGAAIGELLK